MFDVYDKLKELIPIKKCQKFRKDKEFTIVTNLSNEFFYLNETASFIFLLCDGLNSIEVIQKSIQKEYEAESQIIKTDIVRVIRDLQWKGIIGLKKSE